MLKRERILKLVGSCLLNIGTDMLSRSRVTSLFEFNYDRIFEEELNRFFIRVQRWQRFFNHDGYAMALRAVEILFAR